MPAKRVLVVEAESTQNFCLTKLLTNEGYEVESTVGMTEAMRLSESTSPDIVLIDSKLPDGDGFALCQRIRNSQSNLKVVIMSEFSRSFEIEKSRALGAQACLAKPFSFEFLKTELTRIVQMQSHSSPD